MTTKNVRAMTPKRFVSYKLSGKVSAEGFLSAHWDFLKGQEYLTPILEAYENKELLPTPTVQLCQSAVLSHILELETNKGVSKIQANKEGSTKVVRRKNEGEVEESEAVNARYQVTLFCKFYDREGVCTIKVGEVERKKEVEREKDGVTITKTVTEKEPAIFNCNSYNDASRLADRKLCDRGDSVYATIVNTHDRPITTTIQRDDAIARVYKNPRGPAVTRTGAASSSLKFGIKAKNDRSHFSRG
jgi:hypothetical protein